MAFSGIMNISYDEVRRIHRLEKNTSQIVEVEQDFYSQLHDFLKKEKHKYLASLKDFSVSGSFDFSNLKKMVEEIFAMREKKIISRAIVSSRTKEVSHEGLALQEKELFDKVFSVIKEHEGLLLQFFSNDVSAGKEQGGFDTISVKILSDVPSFVSSDMKEYGPFSKDDLVELPLRVAMLLTKRNLAIAEKESG